MLLLVSVTLFWLSKRDTRVQFMPESGVGITFVSGTTTGQTVINKRLYIDCAFLAIKSIVEVENLVGVD